MTREEKALFHKEMVDSVVLLYEELLQRCREQSQRLQEVMRRNEAVIKTSEALLNKIRRISN
jgi:L-serine deaminase